MKKNKLNNKSVSTSTNKLFSPLYKNKSTIKNPLSIKLPSFLYLNEILDLKQNKNDNNRYYYKNPQFLNSSNIQNQIDILSTNINNNKNNKYSNTLVKNDSSNSFKILPKLKSLNNLETKFGIKNVKNEETSFDSTLNNKNDSNLKLPNISISTTNLNKKKLNINNVEDSEQKRKEVEYDYRSIFSSSNLFKEKVRYIDNKLNIVYCQNESQYKFIMEKRNKLLKNGSVLKFEEDSEKVKGQVKDIKEKIKFMKNVMDFSYPGFMLTKIKSWEKNLSNQKHDTLPTPYENQKNQIKKRNNLRTDYLKQNLKIFPLKI
jgi:hypothetical protein